MTEIIEDNCLGCGICANICPEGIQMVEGKARIKDETTNCLKDAADACPVGAIILEGENGGTKTETIRTGFNQEYRQGTGQGRGLGAGQGRGLGRGSRDGRGGGHGGGGRRKW